MASSSSSSNFNSASDSHSRKYEVFISFRGEDTRKGFVDHLYKALVQQGIQTYKDDETLPRGSTIGPALLKAIEESRIAVVVFSENYANSSWCLDELAHIVECMENKGQIVLPVFYNVDPSEVRKQNGNYGEAFSKHECESEHKVDSWRNALLKVGNLSGWVSKEFANGHEAKCIEDIVTKICDRLSPLIANVDKNLIGIETRLKDLNSMLKIGSGGVRMVGIWGVGGAGKSTLASAAYMEISHQFDACCLLENIRDESSKIGLTKLQEKFLSLITKTTVVVGSETEGKAMIKRKLGCKSVLVVLDDVNEREQLEALAGSNDWFGEGSRIIITTRDEHLLALNEATIYEVSLLSDVEAIKLFSRHAFKKDEPVEDYKTLSQEVVSYSGRLPLALEILGSFLYTKNKEEWISALAKLKHIPNVKVMERLKISYDGLEHAEKELFLDIACSMRRWEINDAMRVLDACSFHPGVGLKVLLQKSLIKVSNGVLDMHDLIEEMAHYIVRGDHPDNPEKQSRIWKFEDFVSLCAMGAAAPETEVLAMQDQWYALRTFADAFKEKKKSFWCREPVYENDQGLPNVIANMKKLRWIDWEEYPPSSFPSNFQPTRLGCLMLRYSSQKQLWKGCKILPSLKILDLHGSSQLKRTPDFSGLPCLERLNLEDCRELEEIHPSIGYHKRLVWVNMKDCWDVKWFPPIIHMIKLETLVLSKCNKLETFPEIQTNMDSLSLPSLKILDLRGSRQLERTPDFSGLPCLERLNLEDCEELKEIHPSIGYHKGLVWVNMKGCEKLKWFPPIIHMIKLETLVLSKCKKLETFSEIQTNMDGLSLPSLKILDLQHSQLERTPDFSGLPCLERLNLEDCKELKEIHPSIGYHKGLVWVNMKGCEKLKRFPPIIHMIKLETLVLSKCIRLKKFPDMQTSMSLPSLKILDLHSYSLERTPDFTGLPCLERLNLEECWDLKEIHPSIGYHKSLIWVNMKGCWKLKWFPPIIDMIKLETLVLSKCTQLKTFPEIQMNMDSLVNLHMDETGIELVPPSVGQFCTNLVTFDLRNCDKLQRIEGNFRLLKRLKYLKISGCIQLEKMEGDFFSDECCLEELPQFPCISRKLDLSWCNLGNGDMPSDWSGFINLQVLDLSHNKFSRLHSSLSQIPCLKFLELSSCGNLVELPDLPSSIAILIAQKCESLQSVGDLSNCKWLWKVSFKGSDNLIGGERGVHSMIQINSVEDRFMSILLPHARHLDSIEPPTTMMTLQLPDNWYNDFSGFLLSAKGYHLWDGCSIYIKQEILLSMDSQPHHHHWEEFFDRKPEFFSECGVVGYVPFASLSHTSWWNSTYTHITFQIKGLSNPRVRLVPRKSKSRERAINYSECWEEIGDKKTFQIIDNSDSSQIEIKWYPHSWIHR